MTIGLALAGLLLNGATASEHWSYQPVVAPDPGATIDGFIDTALAKENLEPVARANALTLIRRVTFDLIGLPPSPDEVTAFQRAFRDDPDQAMVQLVDRLLASRHYGERWGSHWLDHR